jgi:hypothetical protein
MVLLGDCGLDFVFSSRDLEVDVLKAAARGHILVRSRLLSPEWCGRVLVHGGAGFSMQALVCITWVCEDEEWHRNLCSGGFVAKGRSTGLSHLFSDAR